MPTMPVPQPNAPNAQGVSNPPNDPITANGNTDPSQGVSSANDGAPDASQTVQPQTASTNATIPSVPQPQQPDQSSMMVSNAPANAPQPSQPSSIPGVSPQAAQHPSVQRASVLRNVALALSGGQRYNSTIDPNTGAITRTPVPLSKGDLSLAIVSEVLSGAMAGLSVKPGPGNLGRAAGAGYQAQQAQAQQVQQQQQQDLNQTAQQLARRASIFETNSRTLLNTSEAEAQGADAIDKLIKINKDSGVSDVDPILLDNGGQPMIQAEMMAGIKAGKINATDVLGPVVGRQEVTDPNGNKHWEATHLIVKDPSAPISLTQEQWDKFAANGVKGFTAGTKIPQNYSIPVRQMQSANEALASHTLANQRLSDLSATLHGTDDAELVPKSIDFSKPGTETALRHYQGYVSHNAANLADPLLALKQMGANPKDAPFVDTVAQTFGGWNVLEAAHNRIADNAKFSTIDSQAKANAVLSEPALFKPSQVQAAQNFVNLTAAQKAAGKAKGAGSNGGGDTASPESVSALGEALARGSITEDQIPNFNKGDTKVKVETYLSQHHPNLDQASVFLDGTERKQRDLGRNSIENLNVIQDTLDKRPDLIGLISGRVSQGKGLTGTNDPDLAKVNQALDNWALASTGAHGIRSVEARTDAKRDLLNSFKNGPAAIDAAINQSRSSLQQFAHLGKPKGVDGSAYVYKQQGTQGTQGSGQQQPSQSQQSHGNTAPQTFAYKTADGKMGWDGTKWVPIGSK